MRCAPAVLLGAGIALGGAALPGAQGPGGAAQYMGEGGPVATTTAPDADQARAQAEACRRLVVQAARNAAGKPYLQEAGPFLIIGNHRVAAGFHQRTLELAAVVDVAGHGALVAVGTAPLWRMTLAAGKRRKTVAVASTDAPTRTHQITHANGRATLALTWRGVSTPEEKGAICATAFVTARPDTPYLHWRIHVDSRNTQRGLWEVDFPHIGSVGPLGDATDTRLLLPWGQGWLVQKPFDQDRELKGQYPAPSAPMQFSAVYGPAGGLYLATHDGRMFIKRFYHRCRKRPRTLDYTLRNLPANRGNVGVDFEMPYDFVMTTFQGDWFTACRLYREWASRQVWCSKGPIHQRTDIPTWYKDLGFWAIAWEQTAIGTYEKWKDTVAAKDQTVADMKVIAKTLGVPTAAHLYGWHGNAFDIGVPEYFPPRIGRKAFRKQVQALHQAGVRVVPYVNGCLWDKSLASYKSLNVVKHCIKDRYGNSYNWRIDRRRQHKQGKCRLPIYWLDWPCPFTPFWQQKMKAVSETLVRDYGADGVYYDVLSGNAHECFDAHHGHTTGGGNYWAQGNRKLLAMCRKAIKKANPDAMMTSEQPSEAYIDQLDSILLYCVQGKPGAVPAFQAVYHDYCILFGNACLNAKGTMQSLPMPVAESFVNGDQLGWFNIWPIFLPNHPRRELSVYWDDEALRKKYVDFVVHVARLRHHAGRKFLVHGRMLAPLHIENDLPVREGYWVRERLGRRRMPAVVHSVWRAPDGTLGLVFCNITDKAQQVTYRLDVAGYGLARGRPYALVRRNIDGGETVIQQGDSPVLRRTEKIPGLRGMILEVRTR